MEFFCFPYCFALDCCIALSPMLVCVGGVEVELTIMDGRGEVSDFESGWDAIDVPWCFRLQPYGYKPKGQANVNLATPFRLALMDTVNSVPSFPMTSTTNSRI